MTILITNDDGICSEGIIALEKALIAKGHEVWVFAPDSQRSSCSHAVSIHRNIKFNKISDRHYATSGFPSDCVLFAFKGLLPADVKIDLVISGINQGYNVSTDLVYSATCGAACEAVTRGNRGIAVSCGDKDGVFCFESAASFVADNLEMLCSMIKPMTYLNVNVPPDWDGTWKKTKLGIIEYHDTVKQVDDNTFFVSGIKPQELVSEDFKDVDFYCVHNEKKVSLTTVCVYPQINN